MRILKSIGLYFIYPFLMFLLGILAHIAYVGYFYPNRYAIPEETYYVEDSVSQVSKLSEPVTTCDTDYYIMEYDLSTKQETQVKEKLPDKYSGMTRQALEEAIQEYSAHPTLEDMERGFCEATLLSFSAKEVRVGKTYQPKEKEGYYLMVSGGKIVVMEEDRETIYLTTDIYAEALSDSLKYELIQGKYITNIEELYGFLESHTS